MGKAITDPCGHFVKFVNVSAALLPTFLLENTIMASVNTIAASSAVSVPVLMIGDRPAIELQDTIFGIGSDVFKAEGDIAKAKDLLDILDSNLHDIVHGLEFPEFCVVRDYFKAGVIDKGRTDDAANKVWERQVKRLVSTFDFKVPKSQAKDAVRKAAKRAEEIQKLAEFGDGELLDLRDQCLRKADNKSLDQVKKLNKELERRNASELEAEKIQRKATADKIITRVKELSKAGTEDADSMLYQVLMLLG